MIVGLALAALWLFLTIAIRGSVSFQESTPWILTAEITLMVALVAFGLWIFARALRGK